MDSSSYNSYIFWGAVSSLFFLSSAPAVFHQLTRIWERRRLIAEGKLEEAATASISINQVFSSFLAVYSFFLFGIVLETPDLFLTIPRAVIGVLLGWILWELYRDRGTRTALFAFVIVCVACALPVLLFVGGVRGTASIRSGSHALVCVATLFMAQGAIAQYLVLRSTGIRGAVSLPMHTVLYLKDFTGLIFGLQIGDSAWSIVVMHACNLIVRAPIILQYLRSK